MEKIEFPEGLLQLDSWVFSGSLIKSVIFPSTLTHVYHVCFYNSTIETADFSKCSKVSFTERTFEMCKRLYDIKLPTNQDSICAKMFHLCRNLISITIPSSVEVLKEESFLECGIKNIIFEGNNLKKIDLKCFSKSGLISITIPDSVEEISGEAFSYCNSLTSIVFSSNSQLKTIGKSILKHSNRITEIYLGFNLTSIPELGLSEAYGLTNVVINESNKEITAIDGIVYTKDLKTLIVCPGGITSIRIRSSVESLSGSAFFNCNKLEFVNFGEGSKVSNIGPSTFYGCTKISTIKFPTFIRNIGSDAFKGCTSLKSIEFPIPCEIKEIGNSAFEGCSKLTNLILSTNITSLGDQCFAECISLETVILPRDIVQVGKLCFQKNTKLVNVEFCSKTLPDTFDDTAFVGCTKLSWVRVSKSFTPDKETVGGVSALRILDNDCFMPTIMFTRESEKMIAEFVLIPLASSDNN